MYPGGAGLCSTGAGSPESPWRPSFRNVAAAADSERRATSRGPAVYLGRPFIVLSRRRSPLSQEHSVGRASDARWALVEDMRVDHRRAHVSMTQKFLHGADIVSVFEQVGGKRVTERVAGRALRDTGCPHSVLDRTLQDRLMQVMTATLARQPLHVGARGWEDPLPSPLPARVGIFAREGPRKLNPAGALPQISLVLLANPLDVAHQSFFTTAGSMVTRALPPLPSRMTI